MSTDLVADDERSGTVVSADGTRIAWFREPSWSADDEAPPAAIAAPAGSIPLLLIHGTTADHTTFRVVGPRFALARPTFSMDRRGRGRSGDTAPYAIAHEAEDVAAVAEWIAAAAGGPVDVLGHSYGGRCALGAARLTTVIRRIVAFESAAPPRAGAAVSDVLERLESFAAGGHPERVLELFMRDVVGQTADEWADFQASPLWSERLAAAGTIPRELRAGVRDADPGRYDQLEVPVLQLVGSDSPVGFREAAAALGARLPHGRLEVIPGARHAAHHTHAAAFVALTEAFLDEH